MSGIAGIIHFDGRPVEPGQVEAMTAAMRHRGPDGISHWRKGSVALGQCMLRTTPESLEETQPLTNEDESLVLVMDGRMDNWEELRRDLLGRGAVLRTRSDAELVLRAYEVWGQDCLPRIDGDFALVIWDARRREAFCARDRLGNKTFHYHWNGKTLAFASELHPVLDLPWVDKKLDTAMVAEILAGEWYSRDETPWSGVMRLVPAHCMVVNSQGEHDQCYWTPDLWDELPFRKDGEYIEAYRELLFDCVRRASRSHRPVAVEVSGGLDSSAVLCVAEQLRQKGSLPAPDVQAYTLAFTDDGDANEVAYARAAAEHAGLLLHEVAPAFMPREWFADRVRAERNFPIFPNAAMFTGIREHSRASGCRVTLTGEGGDEWLAGSRLYYAEALAQRDWRVLRDLFAADVAAVGTGPALNWLLRQGLFPLLPPRWQKTVRTAVRRLRANPDPPLFWLAPRARRDVELRRQRGGQTSSGRVRNAGQRELLATLQDAFSAVVMEGAEQSGALHGMEMRYPMRHHRFVQFAFSVPERLRLNSMRSKYIHVQALQGILPQVILERATKAEFSIMFRHHLDHVAQGVTDMLPRRHPEWLSADGMRRLYEIYRTRPDLGWPIWVLWSAFCVDHLTTSAKK